MGVIAGEGAFDLMAAVVDDGTAPARAGRGRRIRRAAGRVVAHLSIGTGAAGDEDPALGHVAAFIRGTDRGAADVVEATGTAAARFEVEFDFATVPFGKTTMVGLADPVAAAVVRLGAGERGRPAADRF